MNKYTYCQWRFKYDDIEFRMRKDALDNIAKSSSDKKKNKTNKNKTEIQQHKNKVQACSRSGFNFTTAQNVSITAMINHKFISFSVVQIYDISYIHLHKNTVLDINGKK